jgi:DNA-binding HxlR family transcriptional regulator
MINYLQPAVNEGFVELTQPDIITSPSQQYRLSAKGKHLRKILVELALAVKNTEQVTEQVTEQPTEQVELIIQATDNEMSGQELMRNMGLKHRPTFLYSYLQPALQGNWLEMTIPDNTNDPNQKYRITPKGKSLQQQLKNKK